MADFASTGRDLLADTPVGRDLLSPQTASDLQNSSSMFAAFMNNLGQGLTFGFSDELAAGLAAGVKAPFSKRTFGDIFDEQLATERANLRTAGEEFPITSGAGLITGGVAQGLKAAQLAGQSLQQIPRLPRLIGIGAGEGALFGAGTAEDDRLKGAGRGAAIGAVATPVGAGVMNLIGRAVAPIGSAVGRAAFNTPRRQAERVIRAALERDDIDPRDINQLLRGLGSSSTMADLGENLSGLARGASAKPGPTRTVASAFLNNRQRGQQARLLDAAGVGDVDNFKQAFSQVMNTRSSAAAPLYNEAYSSGLAITDDLARLLARPTMQKSLKRAATILADEGGETGHVRLMDAVKRDLDDQISKSIRAGTREKTRRLLGMKNELLDVVDDQVPAYAQARQLFSSEAGLRDSMNLGRSMMTRRLDLDDVELAVQAMTDGERHAFRMGSLRGLVDKMESTPETRNAAQKLIESTRARELLRLSFPDDESFQRFLSTAEAESTFSFVRGRVLGGSSTARIGQEVEDLNRSTSVLGAVASGGDPIATGISLLRSLGFSDVSDETLEEISSILFRNVAPATGQTRRLAGQSIVPALSEVERQTGAAGALNALMNQPEQ